MTAQQEFGEEERCPSSPSLVINCREAWPEPGLLPKERRHRAGVSPHPQGADKILVPAAVNSLCLSLTFPVGSSWFPAHHHHMLPLTSDNLLHSLPAHILQYFVTLYHCNFAAIMA